MSMHRSLKSKKFKPQRNVTKRWERLQKLQRNGEWVEGLSIYGLPKEKIQKIKFKIKKQKEEIENEGQIPYGQGTI